MRVAILTTDNRDHHRIYSETTPRFGPAPEALIQGFAGLPGVEVHIVSCTQRPMQSPEKLADNLWYHSVLAPKIGWLRTLYQGCIRATRRKLREIQPNIVHGQGTERDCSISAVLSGFPNVLTIHGNMRPIAKAIGARPFSFHWLAARLESWVIPRTAGVVCLSRYTQRQVESLARKTWLQPNAASEAFFQMERSVSNERTVLCVANIIPYKNQNELIRSLDPIADTLGIKLVFLGKLAGGEDYGREFLELVGSRSWCQFLGFKEGEALRDHMRRASLLVLPTLEDNCPMVVLEAMAAGLLVAASNVGGVPDLIQPGVNGLLFDPRKPEEMRNAIVRLLSDQELASAMSLQGRKWALEKYHPRRVAQRHVEIYREILGRPVHKP